MSQTLDHHEAELSRHPGRRDARAVRGHPEGLSQASVGPALRRVHRRPLGRPRLPGRHDDPRWILPADVDPLGAHPWYQAQPLERQIEIGLWRQANILKVGAAVREHPDPRHHAVRLRRSTTARRSSATSCTRRPRSATTTRCSRRRQPHRRRRPGHAVAHAPDRRGPAGAGSTLPVSFFIGVLAGEEPIDHTQKGILRGGKDLPPLMSRIMEIHVAEEARHISFAHEYIKRHGPNLGRDRQVRRLAALPGHHAGAVRPDHDAAQGVPQGVRHPAQGHEGPLLEGTGVA